MDKLILTPGDFMKNAGIVGFLRLIESYCRRNNKRFIPTDVFDVKELLAIDLAQAYIDVFIEHYGKNTKTAEAFKRLDSTIELLEGPIDNIDLKKLQDALDFIHGSLSAASLKSGFAGIKNEIDKAEVYEDFVAHKLKLPKKKENLADTIPELLARLKETQQFCLQPKVRETFVFKTIMYSVINKFWSNKCFLYRNNVKKQIVALIASDFTESFNEYLSKTDYKEKSACIACGAPLAQDKEKCSISFLIDMADDLGRKTSAFWNCKPDAYLCPVCAFLCALAPLGFCQVDNGDFVFINTNDSIQLLWANNQTKMESDGKVLSYHKRIDNAILQLVNSKAKLLNNIQVVTRFCAFKKSNDDVYKYRFNVIDRELIRLTQEKSVQKAIERLAQHSLIKLLNGDFVNVYRICIDNLLNYRNQFNLLYFLITESLKQSWVNTLLYPVFDIQCAQLLQKQEDGFMDVKNLQYFASKAGSELRPLLVENKVGHGNAASLAETKQEDILRGVVYQLTNAMKVHSIEQFMDLIIRLYSSCKLPIPTVFTKSFQSEDQFAVIGYAFILGLKGAFYTKEKKEGE